MSYNDWSLSSKKLIRAFPNLPTSLLRFLPYALLLLGFLGLLDATYLTVLHYKNAIPPCTLHGCEVVLTSRFATVFGFPIALFGAGYYLAVMILTGMLLNTGVARVKGSRQGGMNGMNEHLRDEQATGPRQQNALINILLALTGVGLVVGIFLVFLQAFVLHAFCQYCLTSELIDFLLFDCAWWLWRKTE